MSHRNEPSKELKVFVSYSRRDLTAADALVESLESNGFQVLIDKRDLPYGEEWQLELSDLIWASDTVVWLVSPDSIVSNWVNWELGEVNRLNKRLIPIQLLRIDMAMLPKALGKLHLLPSEGEFIIERDLPLLVDALNTDHAWLKEATRLADRARQWQRKARDPSLLLRAAALRDAEAWSVSQPRSAPKPSSVALELILASRKAASRRQKLAGIGIGLIAVISVTLAAFAYQQRNDALASQSRFLAKLSREQTASGDAATGVLLALAGLPSHPTVWSRPTIREAIESLRDGVLSLRERFVLSGHSADVNTVRFDSTGTMLLTSSDDGSWRLWNAETGALKIRVQGHSGKAYKAVISADGKLVASIGSDHFATIWDARRVGLFKS